MLPWIFVIGVAAGLSLPSVRQWYDGVLPSRWAIERPLDRDTALIVSSAATSGGRQEVDVLRIIDGDTFEARIHLRSDFAMVTRVRLRGVDAPELKAACAREFQMARAASTALRKLLAEGDVAIFNIGSDKYSGRIVADAATRLTPSVSEALLAAGHARRYGGGHRDGWC